MNFFAKQIGFIVVSSALIFSFWPLSQPVAQEADEAIVQPTVPDPGGTCAWSGDSAREPVLHHWRP